MQNFIDRFRWLPTNVIHLLADRDPEAKKVSEAIKGQMPSERKREIVRQEMARMKVRSK